MSTGLAIIAATTVYRMTFAQNMTFGELIPPQLAFGLGMPLFFVPLMSVSMAMVPPDKTATAAGLINFLRSMSGAFATAIVTTMWSDDATRDRVQLVGEIKKPHDVLMKLGGTPHHMGQALQKLDGMVESQSVMLATNRTFLEIGVIVACVSLGVWLLPRPRGPMRLPVGGH